MTQTLSVDSNNDLFLGKNGNISVSVALQAVLELCEHVVKTRLGEVALNSDIGIPYFELVWNGIPNQIQFEAAVRSALLQVPDVLEVVTFITTIVDTTLTYRAEIRTIYGGGTISG